MMINNDAAADDDDDDDDENGFFVFKPMVVGRPVVFSLQPKKKASPQTKCSKDHFPTH